ncbi:hypothetical protein E2C01_087924 [Portunus trituberculatus]|uniref:Uncharacterized protein n=1 Tax=Portunus trituberculatus TaxID=210409 RepID=A0A5B7JE07_PORTR|nr:hypothetical protein [Portunus trituberculatus]
MGFRTVVRVSPPAAGPHAPVPGRAPHNMPTFHRLRGED